jgi:hypothetical protein
LQAFPRASFAFWDEGTLALKALQSTLPARGMDVAVMITASVTIQKAETAHFARQHSQLGQLRSPFFAAGRRVG